MWIKSYTNDNTKSLINLDNVNEIMQIGKRIRIYTIYWEYIKEYPTEERAKEVIEAIRQAISNGANICTMPEK